MFARDVFLGIFAGITLVGVLDLNIPRILIGGVLFTVIAITVLLEPTDKDKKEKPCK